MKDLLSIGFLEVKIINSPFRVHDRVRLPDGSAGTLQYQNPDGTWRVWFNARDWKGDPKWRKYETRFAI